MSQAVYIGVDLGGTNLKAALVQHDGKILISTSRKTVSGPPEAGLWKDMVTIIQQLMDQATQAQHSVMGLGIGVPGIFDVEQGYIREFVNIPGWEKFPLAEKLSQTFHLPVFVDNDVNVTALGEFYFGKAKGYQNVLCLTLGTGLGGAWVLNGELYRGSTGAAGEIGHIPILDEGYECGCGQRGCLETLVGNKGLMRWVREGLDETSFLAQLQKDHPLTPKDLDVACLNNDPYALLCWQKFASYLGKGLVGLINAMNPEKIIIGGGISRGADFFLEPLRKFVYSRAMKSMVESLSIEIAQLGEEAGVVGAAALVRNEMNH